MHDPLVLLLHPIIYTSCRLGTCVSVPLASCVNLLSAVYDALLVCLVLCKTVFLTGVKMSYFHS